MSKIVTVPLDCELETLLNRMLLAKKTKNKSQIIREAIWDYSKKILNDFNSIELKGATNGDC